MANLIFPTGFEEKETIAQNDMILMADSEDSNKIKKAKYSNLKGEKGDTGPKGEDGADGKDGADGTSATITVGTTTTGEAGTDASVTNSGTSSAAVLNFTIPQGVAGADGKDGVDGKDGKDGTDGQDGAAATITVGTTTTGSPGTNASVTNTGTSSAAVFDFTIPQGATGATGNGIASITSSKSGKITTVTITETNGDVKTFIVSDGADGQGSGDVLGPNSSTDGNVVLFDGNTGKIIKDSTKQFTPAGIGALPSTTKYGASISVSIDTTDYKITTTLKDQDGNTLGTAQVIDLPLESVVVSGSYDSVNKKVVLTLENGSTVEFSVADLVAGLQSEITNSNKLDADLVDDSTSTNKFVTASDKTTWSGKQDALVSGTNIKTINNQDLLGSGNITISGGGGASVTEVTVSTAYGTAAKVGTTTAGNYTPSVGDLLLVNFVYGNTANSVTLNIDNSGAKNIEIGGANANRNTLNLVSSNTATNSYVLMTYDGTNYVTHSTANTSYSAGTGISISGSSVISSTSNIQVFYLASTSDLTNAQAAYDWQIGGKTALVIYNDKPYIFTWENGVSMTFACFLYEEQQEAGNSKTSLIRKVITLSVSSGTVTSISANSWNNVMASVLKTDTDYANPYTPQYDGSPATKKYVDDHAGTNYSRVTKTISGGEVELGLRTIVNVPTSNFTLTAPATLKDGEEYAIRIISETSYTMTLGTGFTNPRNVDTTLSANATDQYVFLAIGGELELQPLVDTGA